MGSALVLPGSVDFSPFGKFHEIEGTWDSTVALIDFGLNPVSAVPGQTSTYTNLMRNRMAEVTGLALASCDFQVDNTVLNSDANRASAEVTGKGAIHCASPQAGVQTVVSAFGMNFSKAFGDWLLANSDAGNDYAVLASVFVRCTRDQLESNPGNVRQSMMHIANGTSATGNNMYITPARIAGGANASRPLAAEAPYVIAPTPIPYAGEAGLAATASQGWNGTKPADSAAAISRRLFVLGLSDAWSGFNQNRVGSYVIYRAQLDLINLSDIGGANVVAKAEAMRSALAAQATRDFAQGGRFYGDTFTPAATLKP